MLQKKFIGATITVSKFGTSVLIEDDSSKFKYYKDLGLDYIFKSESKPVKMTFPKVEKQPREKADEPLMNKSKAELVIIAEGKGLEVFVQMPKRAIIELINDSDKPSI